MAPLISNCPSSLSGSSCTGGEAAEGKPVMMAAAHSRSQGQIRSVSDSALHVRPTSPGTPTPLQDQEAGGSFLDKPRRRISFDERVSVREFERNSWHQVHDTEQLSPITGGSKPIIAVPQVIVCPRDQHGYNDLYPLPLFPHYPLSPTRVRKTTSTSSMSTTTSCSGGPFSLHGLLRREIRQILMVDPHDIFLTLFSKRLHQALPHPVNIITAHSSDEALDLCSKHSFDIIITEERLSLFHRHRGGSKVTSGSALLGHLRQHSPQQFRDALLIGVSAHWPSDHATMVQSGADYCWSKAPPPTLNKAMLEELLHTLLLKRGKHEVAKTLMVISSSEGGLSSSPPDEKQ